MSAQNVLRGMPLQQAQRIISNALEVSQAVNAPPLSIVVLDNGGHQKAMVSQDGVGTLRAEIAKGKANAALAMGFDSAQFYHYVENGVLPEMFAGALNGASKGQFVPLPGGVIIYADDGNSILGAIGISGASSQLDDSIARQAISQQR